MIRLVENAADAARFQAALAARPGPVAAELAVRYAAFAALPASGWRFYTGGEADPALALGVRGASAELVGEGDGQELALALQALGAKSLRSDCAAGPEGWAREAALSGFYAPKEPRVPPLPAGFRLDEAAPMGAVVELFCAGVTLAGLSGSGAADNLYSETCAMRNRGLAAVWGLWQGEALAATAGAYAICPDCTLLGGVETAGAFRRRGLAGALVTRLAERYAPRGPVFLLARPGAEGFYRALGFAEKEGVGFGWRAPEQEEQTNR